MTCGSAKSQRMTGFVYTVLWVMPGNATRMEGMASRNAASKRARTASGTTARHLAIVALHGPQRACGPDQILSRKTRHDYQGFRLSPHRGYLFSLTMPHQASSAPSTS